MSVGDKTRYSAVVAKKEVTKKAIVVRNRRSSEWRAKKPLFIRRERITQLDIHARFVDEEWDIP